MHIIKCSQTWFHRRFVGHDIKRRKHSTVYRFCITVPCSLFLVLNRVEWEQNFIDQIDIESLYCSNGFLVLILFSITVMCSAFREIFLCRDQLRDLCGAVCLTFYLVLLRFMYLFAYLNHSFCCPTNGLALVADIFLPIFRHFQLAYHSVYTMD